MPPALATAPLQRTVPGFSYTPPPAGTDAKLPTGVARLDVLLGGGYTPRCATLLYGPPFCGKQQLQQLAIVRAARAGVPVTVVLHTVGAEAMSRRLRAIDPLVEQAEADGTLAYVDVHSHALGEPMEHPGARYVRDPAEMVEAVGRLAGGAGRGPGLLAVESVSTLLVDLGPARAFTTLRTLLGKALARGGVALLCLEGGMHSEAEVQMAKHLCAGMIEMRKKGEAHCLHVEGLETAFPRPGWIEYEFSARSFRVTGSFASRTIR